MSSTSAGHPQPMSRAERRILILVSGAAFLDFLDVTVVNLAFPALSRDFPGSSVSALTWIITGYAVTFAALLAAGGRLADVLGRRRIFLTGVSVFTLSSLACALSPSLAALIGARFIQGGAAAMILPSGLGIVLAATPPERRAAAVGIWGAAAGAAAAFGPTVGGILVHLIDWRAIFFINIPLGIAIVLLGRATIPDSGRQGGRLPDIAGTGLLIGGIGLLVLGVTQASNWGWTGAATLISLAGGLGLGMLALARSRRHPAPAVEISLWGSRPYALSNLASVFFGATGYAAMLVGVLFLVSVLHYSELTAGFAMSPGAIAGGIAAAIAGRVVDKRGQAVMVIAGALVLCLGCVYTVLALGRSYDYAVVFLPGNVINGVGMGMTAVGLSSAAAMYIEPGHYAAATGLNMTARQVGGALGVAILAAIFGAQITAGLSPYTDVFIFCASASAAAALIGIAIALRTPQPDATKGVSTLVTARPRSSARAAAQAGSLER
jgi:EmrB/QacA subfamily drug resistance transporter